MLALVAFQPERPTLELGDDPDCLDAGAINLPLLEAFRANRYPTDHPASSIAALIYRTANKVATDFNWWFGEIPTDFIQPRLTLFVRTIS